MKKRKIIALFMAAAIPQNSMTAFAAEGETEDNVSSFAEDMEDSSMAAGEDAGSAYTVMGTDLDSIFASMQESLLNGEEVSISEAFNSLSSQTVESSGLFDLSDVSLGSNFDSGLLNLQYEEMVSDMYSGSSILSGGSSLNCLSLFEDTYGDVLSEIQLEEPTIPEGFTTSAMLSAGQAAIEDAYSDVTSSSTFSTVKSSISIGEIFSIANAGLSMPDLASGETLSSMLDSLSSGNESEISSEYSSYLSSLTTVDSDYLQDMVANTKSNLLSMADIADNSVLFPDEGETSEGNVSERLDELRQTRRSNSLVGSGINAIENGIDSIGNAISDAGDYFSSGEAYNDYYNFCDNLRDSILEFPDKVWDAITGLFD